MNDHDVTTHNSTYTFIEFISDLLERVAKTHSLNQELTVELPHGHKVSLRVQILDAELANEVSESLH